MAVCDEILKKDISPSCDDPVVPGYEQEGVIINRDDIDLGTTAFASGKTNIIETLALKSGKKGYKVVVPGNSPFTGSQTALATGTYRNTFTNTIALVVLDNGPEVCSDIIDGLANGTYVVVLENKFKGLQKETTPGNCAFQVYGYYQGLRLLPSLTISTARRRKVDGRSRWKNRSPRSPACSCSRPTMIQPRQPWVH